MSTAPNPSPGRVFDPQPLAGLFGDAPGVIGAVLETFSTSMQDHVRQLQAARDARDVAQLLVLAHRIKGAACMSGAMALAQAAEHLEQVARSAASVRDVSDAHAIDAAGAALAIDRQWELLHRDAAFVAARQGGRAN